MTVLFHTSSNRMKSKTFDQVLSLMLKMSIPSSSAGDRLEGFLFGFVRLIHYKVKLLPYSSHATVSCHSWSNRSAVRLEVDQGIACLGQLCDGDSSSLFDILRHGSHLLWSDVDELSSVINHTYRGKERTLKSALWLPLLPNRHQSLLLEGTVELLSCVSYLGQAEQCGSSQAFISSLLSDL